MSMNRFRQMNRKVNKEQSEGDAAHLPFYLKTVKRRIMSEKQQRNPQFAFVKCNLNLSCMFDASEILFIMHMVQIAYLRSKGYNTVWSKAHLMQRMNIRLRTFDRCVKRMTELKLLDRMPQEGMYDYLWNMGCYNHLLQILSATTDLNRLREFCRKNFIERKRDITSISDMEIKLLGKKVD